MEVGGGKKLWLVGEEGKKENDIIETRKTHSIDGGENMEKMGMIKACFK